MDFRNGKFLEELNSARKRIIPINYSRSSISTDSIELNLNDTENNYINLETFTNSDNQNITFRENDNVNRNTVFRETNIDTVTNQNQNQIQMYNYQRVFEKLNRTLELNTSVINESKNNCCQTVTIMILSSAYLLGLIILNDFILLTYFIRD
jgi:hypothetical protein|tara:strand:- start:471 stop:926 length:456 start_codon:yes stop_codon:yes gene_type:complete